MGTSSYSAAKVLACLKQVLVFCPASEQQHIRIPTDAIDP
jgi:hypothetical protein